MGFKEFEEYATTFYNCTNADAEHLRLIYDELVEAYEQWQDEIDIYETADELLMEHYNLKVDNYDED